MSPRNTFALSTLLVGSVMLTACSTPEPSPVPTSSIGDGHGFVVGAQEVAEPPLHLLTVSRNGAIDQMDLLDESWAEIGSFESVTDIVTDGRYVFASDAENGTVAIIDSGMWTRDHEDHFHYYRATPRVVGVVEGDGAATISPGSSATGIVFADSGDSVMLDNAALGDGDVVERFRLSDERHAGSLVQLGSFALRTTGEAEETSVQVLSGDGDVTGAKAACADAGIPFTTSVGVAIPCAVDVLLASIDSDDIRFERIAYPTGDAPTATSFDAREGRPSPAGRAGDAGSWLLDTRARTLTLVPSEQPLLQVTAVSDDGGHILGLTIDGRVTVFSADRGAVATTKPLLPNTLAQPDLLAGVTLIADQQRAYLNAPAEHLLYEIDFADSARIARTFATENAPVFLAETGR
ncbi:hypothetical protein L1277_002265 [Okibacterium sp. HSC-33S16]|uniref:ABC transporter n=1 Tax=Okibacterium sp. HSC-33S16 TaxID=2910965 RepID=UPI00209EB0A9|nr:ABC transporter [Okibacterium sp. HSC-33S16]MCP2032166.1 hypothetical protein [Okibacterium sp. HSC-33S16]